MHLLHVHPLIGAILTYALQRGLHGARLPAPLCRGRLVQSAWLTSLRVAHEGCFAYLQDMTRLRGRRCTATPSQSLGTLIARSGPPSATTTTWSPCRRRRHRRPRRCHRAVGRRGRSTASTTGASVSSCAAAACDSRPVETCFEGVTRQQRPRADAAAASRTVTCESARERVASSADRRDTRRVGENGRRAFGLEPPEMTADRR